MQPSRKTLHKLIPSAFSLLLFLGSFTVFAACGIKEDGSWMRCHSAQTMVTIFAAVLSACLLLQAFTRQKALRVVLNGIGIAGSAIIFLLPGKLMPMCMMHTMHCYTLFQPFVRIMAVLVACSCLIQVIQATRERRH